MDIEKEIKVLLRRNIMNEINGLGIRAAIREEIEASGITKGNVKKLVEKAIDSYVRSADIVAITEKTVNELIQKTVKEEVKKYIDSPCSYVNKPRELLVEHIKKALFKEFYDKYSFTVTVNSKGE